MKEITINLSILYANDEYTSLSNSNQAKFIKLYHYTKSHSTSTAIMAKGISLTEWDMAKILQCDIRTTYNFLKACKLITKREDAYHILDPFRAAEVKGIKTMLSKHLSDQSIAAILSKTNTTPEYVQLKIQNYTDSGHTNPKQLFSMIIHDY